MNKKENQLARNSALAATAAKEIVIKRGHRFDEKVTLPIVIEDDFENINKTKKVIEVLEKIGINSDILRSANGKHVRAGKGKMRGRRYRVPKSLLIVSLKENIEKSSENLSGVDITKPHQLNIELLAPGGIAGRLTVFTKSALTKLGGAK
jgi:large subunit ribosomal protein L4e